MASTSFVISTPVSSDKNVLEYTAVADFPATGETETLYVSTSTNSIYRWDGSAYTELGSSLALGETSSTAYRGDRGKTAYDHATNKGIALYSDFYKFATNAEGHVISSSTVSASDILNLDFGFQNEGKVLAVSSTGTLELVPASGSLQSANGVSF